MNSNYPCIGINRLRFSTDGPGITTLVASYGCVLRCKYCLNPHCFDPSFHYMNLSIEDLYEKVKIDNLYFQSTGGGITFGGGEPLLYAGFIKDFVVKYCKLWNVTLETSLNVNSKNIRILIDNNCVDYYIVDIKDMNDDIYYAYTGKHNDQVISNLQYLIQKVNSSKIKIRIPLINGFNKKTDQEYSAYMLQNMGFQNLEFFEYKTNVKY